MHWILLVKLIGPFYDVACWLYWCICTLRKLVGEINPSSQIHQISRFFHWFPFAEKLQAQTYSTGKLWKTPSQEKKIPVKYWWYWHLGWGRYHQHFLLTFDIHRLRSFFWHMANKFVKIQNLRLLQSDKIKLMKPNRKFVWKTIFTAEFLLGAQGLVKFG